MFEDLLDVDVHLPQKGEGDGVAVAFVGQDGAAALEAQRFEDGFRNPVGQAVEWADDNDPVVALAVGVQPFADGGNGFALERGRDAFGGFLEEQGDVVRPGHQQAGSEEEAAVMLLIPALGLVAGPLAQVILTHSDPLDCQGAEIHPHVTSCSPPLERRLPVRGGVLFNDLA